MLRIALAVLAASLAAPAAEAATVTRATDVISGIAAPIVTHTVTVEAAPGETNALTLTGGRDAVLVHDAGAPLTAGEGCRPIDAATVRCRTYRDGDTFVDAVVRLGDGDDRAAIGRATGAPALAPQVEGGDGAD